MYYVEFLRVMRTLRIVGYVCGAIVLLALVGRPFSHGGVNDSDVDGVDYSKIPARMNADGSSTKTFTGKHGDQITIRTGKDGIETITVVSALKAGSGNVDISVGGTSVRSKDTSKHKITVTTNDPRMPAYILMLIAAGAAGVVATLLGLALSRENDGHLELAWTKPASREIYALGSIVLDAAGIIATAAAAFLTIVLVLTIYGAASYVQWDERLVPAIAFTIVFALSFYGIVLAATSSMRRGGLVLGLLWPVALILPGLVHVEWNSLGTVARVLNTINPVAYFYAFSTSPNATQIFTLLPNGTAIQILALLALFVICLALSLAQWRRLEA